MALIWSRIGFLVRETGQALERFGYDMSWVYVGFERYREKLCRSQPVAPLCGHAPDTDKRAFIAPCANVIGDVSIARGASIFYNVVIRGDAARVTIGKGTNIQDGSTVATARSAPGAKDAAVTIGESVTIGHGATLHSCSIQDEALVGMGAVILQGAVVERRAMVAANAVVMPGTLVKAGELWAGNPATYKRDLKPAEYSFMPKSADEYKTLGKLHSEECRAASAGL